MSATNQSGRLHKQFPKLLSLLAALVMMALFAQGASAAPAQAVTPQPITKILQVQPIILSNDDGSNTARSIGSPGDESYETVMGIVNEVWAQAGIRVILLPAKRWNNTFANVGDPCTYDGHTGTGTSGDPCTGGTRPEDNAAIYQAAEAAGVAKSNDTIMDAYFQRIGRGWTTGDEVSVSGVGNHVNNALTMFIGDGPWLEPGNVEALGRVFAHEMGHTLGLSHTENDPNFTSNPCPPYNIMLGGGCSDDVPRGNELLPPQIAEALADGASTLVSVPALAIARAQVVNLLVVVLNMSIHNDIRSALVTKLIVAKHSLTENKPHQACDAMKQFDSHVAHYFSEGKLTASQDRQLNTASKDIHSAIGCK